MKYDSLTPVEVPTSDLPYDVVDEEIYITVSDGTRLAARIWRPIADDNETFPAILEYIPYRKRDGTRTRDEEQHGYLAGHGYVCARVDMRGSGDSEGIQMDEYLPIEQQDGLDVIDWLSRQGWSNGNVGMFGLSWGGITSLQMASHRPSALKAIIPVGASDDRYYDDGCYFVGGLAGETVGWGGVMFGFNGRPPDPEIFGDGWREAWLKRLAEPPLFMKTWLDHQQRDDYWLQGTVCTDYTRIEIPVYAISGWTDCWPNTVMRLMKNLGCTRKGLIGPWAHLFPDRSLPGPGVNFLDEMLRWFDRWLKGIENGIEKEPMLTLYRQENVSPDPRHDWRDGVWLDADSWPDASLTHRELYLSPKGISETPTDGVLSVNSPQSLGMMSGDYMPLDADTRKAQMPGEQRGEDAGALCFDLPVRGEPFDIIGTCVAGFEVSTDAGNGLLTVRLCDVSPEGSSTLITYGIMNLAQRDGREVQADVQPGTRYRVSLELNDTAHRIAPGHRLRIAVSNAMFPMAWPVADNHTLTLHLNKCRLLVPQARLLESDATRVMFQQPRVAQAAPVTVLETGRPSRTIEENLSTGKKSLTLREEFGQYHLASADITVSGFTQDRFEISDHDVTTARAEYDFRMGYAREGWNVATEGHMVMTCDAGAFFLRGEVRAIEEGREIYHREWDERIPRKGF
ncbi:CocE/NonD family hydrolase [Roseovarius sp. 2305UL8-3]|uniref:CocE/NonD family hydrolase n=1 Tax=Roseovarius conchicola TaxID=3121636 RepID=UPI003526CC14